jgi:predicted 3-demethylubiquinone-9 3-methyltransferase (glyoxalase superfamily)
MQQIVNFLMFYGTAEEAMNFYMGLFPDSEIVSIARYGANQGGAEGSVMHAKFTLNKQQFMCIDSPAVHDFTFTPAMSLYVSCQSENEVDTLFAALSDGGKIMMALGAYPFSKKYAWLSDKFGVSWQLSFNQ